MGNRKNSTQRNYHFIFSPQNKKEKEKEIQLEQKIKHLENINMANPTDETQNKLNKYKAELNDITNRHTQFLIHRLRQEHFQHGNKYGKYLANQIRRNKEKSTIAGLQDSAGKLNHSLTHSPTAINQMFFHFYNWPYSSEKEPNNEEINSFLNNINLPKIDNKQKNKLEMPIPHVNFTLLLNQCQTTKHLAQMTYLLSSINTSGQL